MDSIIKIQVGDEVLEVDLDLNKLSLQEAVRVEEQIGEEAFGRLVESEEPPRSPRFIRALLYAKIKTHYPNLEVDGFDIDIASLAEDDDEEAGGDSPGG